MPNLFYFSLALAVAAELCGLLYLPPAPPTPPSAAAAAASLAPSLGSSPGASPEVSSDVPGASGAPGTPVAPGLDAAAVTEDVAEAAAMEAPFRWPWQPQPADAPPAPPAPPSAASGTQPLLDARFDARFDLQPPARRAAVTATGSAARWCATVGEAASNHVT